MKPPNAGKGRPKGSKNKPKPATAALRAAMDAIMGEVTARKLVRAALNEAIEGKEIITESADGQTMTKKGMPSWDGFKAISPITLEKMPETVLTPDLVQIPDNPEDIAALDRRYLIARKKLGLNKI